MTQGAGGDKTLKHKQIRDSEATREALMYAGSELFAAHGYDGASVEMIAEKAGVNKAMISYHFGGKKGLHTAIMASTFDEVGQAVSALAESDLPAPAQLEAFLDIVTEVATHRRPAFPALFMREALSAERIDPTVFPRVGVLIGTVMRIIARGVADGSLHPVDPFCAYWSLLTPVTLFLATEPTRKRAQAEGLVPFAFPTVQHFLKLHKETMLRGMCTARDKEKS
jgi:TetR/AcrR family transcriptional regulator